MKKIKRPITTIKIRKFLKGQNPNKLMKELREGYILDFATKKHVDFRKPEEKVRQEYEKILYEDYDYKFGQIDIEVSIQRGEKNSKKNKSEKADIVIYRTEDKNKRKQNEDILGIIETKRPNRKEGIKQLMSYMSATSCFWGVWTNGDEIEYIIRNVKTGVIKREYIFNIPKRGESLEDLGKISKDKLRPVKNLKPIFKRILKTLYSNTNISRKEKLGSEMIRLIFCKIWDEKYNLSALPEFRVIPEENPDKLRRRIRKLFDEVKQELSDDGVFDKHENITLDAKSIKYVVGELEQYSLLKTDKDSVGEAFETFAESKLVGDKGEFFTPREVVKTAIKILDPEPGKTIVDPACGSGGFLIYALEHIWKRMENDKKYKGSPDFENLKKRVAEKCFYGIDKEIDLVKIAKAYMSIIGDGRSKIIQENTLHPLEDFEQKTKELFLDEDNNLKKFDYVTTNPPFGSKIKISKSDSKYFDLGHVWKKEGKDWIKTKKEKETEPQVLFIERCLQMLDKGGKLAIVLPETYFHSPTTKYISKYFTEGNNIIAIIDLAHNTFRPYCNAKTCLLVLEKGKPQQNKIIMGVSEEIGHDHTGRPIYRYNDEDDTFSNEIWDDTEIIRRELDNPSSENNTNVFTIKRSEIINEIYVPRYYWKKKVKKIIEKGEREGYKFIQIKELLKDKILVTSSGHGSPPSGFKGRGEIPYIRVKDIVNWEVYKNPTSAIPEHVYNSIKGPNGINLKEKDVVMIRRGSYRIGSCAMLSPFDKNVLLTKEIQVIRVNNENNKYGIDAFYLLYLLSHELTQKQLYNKIMIDTTLPNIGDRWEELYLPISEDKEEIKKIKKKMKESFEKKWDALKDINILKTSFGNLIT